MHTVRGASMLIGTPVAVLLTVVIAAAQLAFTRSAADDDTTQQMLSAARNGDLEAIRRLLANHVPADSASDGWSAVDLACFTHHLDVARLLLGAGGKLDIFSASALDRTAYVSIALAKNPRAVDQKLAGWTPLHFAAAGDATDAARILIDAGAGVDEHANLVRNTPLQIAAEGGEFRVMKILIAHGANVEWADCSGRTAMTLAIESGSAPAARLLFESGAVKDPSGKAATTYIETAARFGRDDILETLIDRRSGATSLVPALLAASQEGHTHTVKLLISRGADPNSEDQRSGRSALGLAVAGDHVQTAHLLLRSGASVDSSDRMGRTPLHYAALNGSASLVRLLLDGGASMLGIDKRGLTPLDLARVSGSAESVRLLEGEPN